MLRKPSDALFSNVEQITLLRSLCDGNLMVNRLMSMVTQMLDSGNLKMIKHREVTLKRKLIPMLSNLPTLSISQVHKF